VAQKKGLKRGIVGVGRVPTPTRGGFLVVAGFAVNLGGTATSELLNLTIIIISKITLFVRKIGVNF
jgi:hypothetical protein